MSSVPLPPPAGVEGRPAGSYFSPAPPRVLAHRGIALDAPENTLLAFLKALALGAHHIETDIHASMDGVAVISHDRDLSRLTGRDVRIEDLSFAQLTAIDLGAGQTFPSLQQALAAFPKAKFNLDVKSADAVQPTIDAIQASGAIDRVLVTSFSEARRRPLVAKLPGVATSASTRRFALALLGAKLRIGPLVRFALRNIHAVQVPERFRGIRIIEPGVLRMLRTAAVEVHVWTINDPDDMRRLLALGVDGLVTDRADLALAVVREFSRA